MEKLYYSMLKTPFLKNVFVASSERGVCLLDFNTSEKEFLRKARTRFSGEMVRDDKKNKK